MNGGTIIVIIMMLMMVGLYFWFIKYCDKRREKWNTEYKQVQCEYCKLWHWEKR